jgi:hypothetical protein
VIAGRLSRGSRRERAPESTRERYTRNPTYLQSSEYGFEWSCRVEWRARRDAELECPEPIPHVTAPPSKGRCLAPPQRNLERRECWNGREGSEPTRFEGDGRYGLEHGEALERGGVPDDMVEKESFERRWESDGGTATLPAEVESRERDWGDDSEMCADEAILNVAEMATTRSFRLLLDYVLRLPVVGSNRGCRSAPK